MHTATGRFAVGSARFRSRVVFDRHTFVHVLEQEGTVFDTRFPPPVAVCDNGTIYYFLLEGALTFHAPVRRTIASPAIVRMSWRHFEGHDSRRTHTFRTFGAPFRAVEVRTREDFGRGEPSLFAAPSILIESVRTYAAAAWNDESHQPALREMLKAFRQCAILAEEQLHADPAPAPPSHQSELWDAVRREYGLVNFMPSLKDIAIHRGVSVRHAARLMTGLFLDLASLQGGWRTVLSTVRIKVATQLLSNPSLSLHEIARALGYSRPAALATAFRGLGLKSPADMRLDILADPEGIDPMP